uniref:HTH crp-type domain-containing protein n=1 Tax=uncultured prokaryote TaxID=198431 RepID=A0A0H5Q8A7_9ZZZZ|nr:hypothetical protein [uncultured prokaryote]
MKKRHIEQIDVETGEIITGVYVGLYLNKRQNGFQKQGWLAMGQSALLKIAQAPLGDEARRVFFALAGSIDYENWIRVPQNELAELLGMKKGNFSRAISRLEHEGILLRGPKVGRSSTFRLNPELGWKGSAKNHREALNVHRRNTIERMKERGMSVVKEQPE